MTDQTLRGELYSASVSLSRPQRAAIRQQRQLAQFLSNLGGTFLFVLLVQLTGISLPNPIVCLTIILALEGIGRIVRRPELLKRVAIYQRQPRESNRLRKNTLIQQQRNQAPSLWVFLLSLLVFRFLPLFLSHKRNSKGFLEGFFFFGLGCLIQRSFILSLS